MGSCQAGDEEARKNLEHRTFHGLTCVIDHPESWQEDEEDQEFAKALQASREQQRKDEDERNRQEMGSTTAIRIMKMVNLPSPARNPGFQDLTYLSARFSP